MGEITICKMMVRWKICPSKFSWDLDFLGSKQNALFLDKFLLKFEATYECVTRFVSVHKFKKPLL